jgi:FkbM family methyltransferase
MRSARSQSVENIHGHRMVLDDIDSMGLSVNAIFEPLETAFVLHAVLPGSVIVDIGANIGYYTLIFAKCVGQQGTVVAFEPDDNNFRLLTDNVRINGYSNVTPIKAAIADHNGETSLWHNDANRMDHRTYDPGAGWLCEPCFAVRLDDYGPLRSLKVDLIKMDIQGSEPKALAGMTSILTNNPAITLITEFWPYGLRRSGHAPDAFLANLEKLGFRFANIDERSRRIAETTAVELLTSLPENDKWAATNIICSRLLLDYQYRQR